MKNSAVSIFRTPVEKRDFYRLIKAIFGKPSQAEPIVSGILPKTGISYSIARQDGKQVLRLTRPVKRCVGWIPVTISFENGRYKITCDENFTGDQLLPILTELQDVPEGRSKDEIDKERILGNIKCLSIEPGTYKIRISESDAELLIGELNLPYAWKNIGRPMILVDRTQKMDYSVINEKSYAHDYFRIVLGREIGIGDYVRDAEITLYTDGALYFQGDNSLISREKRLSFVVYLTTILAQTMPFSTTVMAKAISEVDADYSESDWLRILNEYEIAEKLAKEEEYNSTNCMMSGGVLNQQERAANAAIEKAKEHVRYFEEFQALRYDAFKAQQICEEYENQIEAQEREMEEQEYQNEKAEEAAEQKMLEEYKRLDPFECKLDGAHCCKCGACLEEKKPLDEPPAETQQANEGRNRPIQLIITDETTDADRNEGKLHKDFTMYDSDPVMPSYIRGQLVDILKIQSEKLQGLSDVCHIHQYGSYQTEYIARMKVWFGPRQQATIISMMQNAWHQIQTVYISEMEKRSEALKATKSHTEIWTMREKRGGINGRD